MKKSVLLSFLLSILFSVGLFAQSSFKVHSHNDYLQKVPFWDAYSGGAQSIEADVILENGKLTVAHEKESIDPNKTLSSLYFEPIQKGLALGLIEEIDFTLLVDLKTEAYSTLDKVIEEAQKFESIFYSDSNPEGLKLIISGSRPKVEDYSKYPSFIEFDYQSRDLDASLPWDKIGMVSLSFRSFSVWNGKGRIVESELKPIEEFVAKVHSFNKPVRFWATPDSKTSWNAFAMMGVDYINTDDPKGAFDYLQVYQKNTFTQAERHDLYQPKFISQPDTPKQIILMIGDGMGLAQISAGMVGNGGQLNLGNLKQMALVKTHAADDFTTDSAAGATAYATGEKTNNRAIGVDPNGQILANLPEKIQPLGWNSGVVTTDQMTGATPSSFYAHHSERDDSAILASWLSKSPLNLFIGGGKKTFQSEMENLKASGFQLAQSVEEIENSRSEKVGFFASQDGVPAMQDGRGDLFDESVEAALAFLKEKNKPFFLMVESGMIDSGGHANDSEKIVREMVNFDKVIGDVIKFADENPGTLVLVTADHETGGVALPQGNVKKGEVELSYYSDDHTGIMVPLFAYGAGSEEFSGIIENSEVHQIIMKLIQGK